MVAAVNSVLEGDYGLREAARLHNVPIETLRRRVTGSVKLDGRGVNQLLDTLILGHF